LIPLISRSKKTSPTEAIVVDEVHDNVPDAAEYVPGEVANWLLQPTSAQKTQLYVCPVGTAFPATVSDSFVA
jgi:hypothetical protein